MNLRKLNKRVTYYSCFQW